jgi:transposase
MARSYSNDLRERVAKFVASGRTVREAAELFRVSVSSVVRWSQRLRGTGSAASRPRIGRPGRLLASEQSWLLGRLAEQPDLTVRALAIELRERGYSTVSHNTVWTLLHSAGFSFKKNAVRRRAVAASDRPKARAVEEVSAPA